MGKLERETGFEPATSTLARSHSTTELFPPVEPLKYHTAWFAINRPSDARVRLKADPTPIPDTTDNGPAQAEKATDDDPPEG